MGKQKQFIDITGQKFGRLTVIKRVENDKFCNACFLCRCDCGNEIVVKGYNLRSGNTKSCGCYMLDIVKRKDNKNKTHGLSDTRLYKLWRHIIERCFNENSKCFYRYGGRGIFMCDEWLNNFQAFYDWSITNGYDENAKNMNVLLTELIIIKDILLIIVGG